MKKNGLKNLVLLGGIGGLAWWITKKEEEIPPEGPLVIGKASIGEFSIAGIGTPNPGKMGQLVITASNLALQQFTYEIVVLFGELNVLGAWTTDSIMSKNLKYGGYGTTAAAPEAGSDGCAEGNFIFPATWTGEAMLNYGVPTNAAIKDYDVWVMIFWHGPDRWYILAEKKFLDAFPVRAVIGAAGVTSFSYNY